MCIRDSLNTGAAERMGVTIPADLLAESAAALLRDVRRVGLGQQVGRDRDPHALGLIYAIMALGVYLTFRILNFADLTVDGSFTTGAAIAAVGIVDGVPPLLATGFAFAGGLAAGLVTGLLHTKGKINGLLAGILTQIGLYSINLRIMGLSLIHI